MMPVHAGQFGLEVGGIQQLLADTGHYRGAIDGVNGAVTRQGIRSWQRRIGVPAHGTWDDETNRATFSYLAPFNPAASLGVAPITPLWSSDE